MRKVALVFCLFTWTSAPLGFSQDQKTQSTRKPPDPLLIEDPSLDPDESSLAPWAEAEEAELSFNTQERRLEHSHTLMFGIGEIRPWQSLSMAMGLPKGPSALYGLYAGGGQKVRQGLYNNKTYEMTMRFSTIGVFGRIYSSKFTHLCLEPSLSLTQWSGEVSPYGLEPEEEATMALTGGFRALGVDAGIGAIATWFLSDHISIDWTFVGLKKTWLADNSISRESEGVEGVTNRVLTSVQVYGLTAIALGLWF